MTIDRTGWAGLPVVLLLGAIAALVLAAAPASASLKIQEATRGKQMTADNDAITAPCPKGTAPIGGGYRTPSFLSEDVLVFPTGSFLGDGGWQASAKVGAGDAEDGFITSFSYCSKLGKAVVTRGTSDDFGPNEAGDLTATCRRSETLVSGGWALSGSADDFGVVHESKRTGKRSWTISGVVTAGPMTMVALADCVPAKGAPKLKTRRSTTASSPTGETVAPASCHQGEQVVSAGFDSDTAFIPSEFHRDTRRTWIDTGAVFGNPGTVTTFAYCEKLTDRK